jgi:hypothetical protein
MKKEFIEWFNGLYGYKPEVLFDMLHGRHVQEYFSNLTKKEVSPERIKCLELWLNGDINDNQFIEEITDND